MIKHVWSVLCERISVDRETNLLSYLTCLEAITVKQLPVKVVNIALGTLWHKEGQSEELLQFQITVLSPSGKETILLDKELVVNNANQRTNISMNGLAFLHAGTHLFRVKMKTNNGWVDVQEIPFNISLIAPKAATSEAPTREVPTAVKKTIVAHAKRPVVKVKLPRNIRGGK